MNVTRNEDGQIVQSGNVTKYIHGGPAPEVTATPHEANRVSGGTLRYDPNTGEMQGGGVTRYQVGQDIPPGSIMATAQRGLGGQLSVELEPGNPASRTVIEQALRDGLVRQTGPDLYEDARAPLQAPSTDPLQPEAAKQAPSGDPLFDQAEAAIWAQEIEPLEQSSYDAAVAGTIAAVATGQEDLSGVAKRLAEANGLDPERAREFVDTGFEWHQRTLTNDLVKRGLVTRENAAEFYEAVRSSPRLAEALQEFGLSGRTDTFRELALEHKRDASTRMEAQVRDQVAAAGMRSMVDRASGELLVQRGSGPWVAWSKLSAR